jgi:hypothetical protein
MLRRGDVSPANKKIAVYTPDGPGKNNLALWNDLYEQHIVAASLHGELPEGYDEVLNNTDRRPSPDETYIRSDTGELWRNVKKQVGAVDTPRTKVVYGELGKGAGGMSIVKKTNVGIELDGLSVKCTTDFGVIAMSSLTDDPLDTTDNILLSAIGRARNTGAQFDGEKMMELGTAPIMAEVLEADIRLKTVHGDKLKVWGVNAEGFYAGKLATTYEDGWLCFHIGDVQNPACYYLIVKE